MKIHKDGGFYAFDNFAQCEYFQSGLSESRRYYKVLLHVLAAEENSARVGDKVYILEEVNFDDVKTSMNGWFTVGLTRYHYENGKKHSVDDKPAAVYFDGVQKWYKNGELHRDGDKPAIVYMDGSQEWYREGELHREETSRPS